MVDSQKRRLEDLGFLWTVRLEGFKRKYNTAGQPQHGTPTHAADCRWDMKFAELQSYRAAHGHCSVPFHDSVRPCVLHWFNCFSLFQISHFPWLSVALFILLERRCFQENPALGHWVSTQRQKYKTGTMDENRKRRLEELGFLWAVRCERGKRKYNVAGQPQHDTPAHDADCTWDVKFAELHSCRGAHGDCNVRFHDSVRRFFSEWFSYFPFSPENRSSHISLAFPSLHLFRSNVAVFRRIWPSGDAKNKRWGQWKKDGSAVCRSWVSCGNCDR
jgi:Helicase associated domain